MNTQKVFAKMLKAHSKGECVSLITDYENAKEIAKLIMSMPDTFIESFQLSSAESDGYSDPWLLSYGEGGVTFGVRKPFLTMAKLQGVSVCIL